MQGVRFMGLSWRVWRSGRSKAARAVAIDVAAVLPDIPAQLLTLLGGETARTLLALLPATLRFLVTTELVLALGFTLFLNVAFLLWALETPRMVAP